MTTVESNFNIEVTVYDEEGKEVDLADYEDEFASVTELVDAGEITVFDEILGHLWLRIQVKRTFDDG